MKLTGNTDLKSADIYLVGSGIFPEREMTLEAVAALERSEICTILPTSNLRSFLDRCGFQFHDISHLYEEGKSRSAIYHDIATYIVERASQVSPLSYLTYGHPMWLDDPARLIIEGARSKGLSAYVIPGISFLDTILASKPVAIGPSGVRVSEASAVVRTGIELDAKVPTFIAQLGALGVEETRITSTVELNQIAPLIEILLRYYPPEHLVTLCDSDETGTVPIFLDLPLCTLPIALEGLTNATTLYLPAVVSS